MKIEFKTDPEYRDLPSGLVRCLTIPVVVLIDGQPLLIPEGFLTDGASVPRILWNIIPPFGPYFRAALLHDFLYKTGRINRAIITRAYADDVFLSGMVTLKVSRIERGAMWAGVRIGGWRPWNKYRREEAAGLSV